MIADPFVQLRLLDLQAVDTALAQLAHRRRNLSELAVIADCDQRAAGVRSELVDAETTLADLAKDQRRMEADVDTVRSRAQKDQQRMAASGVPAKEISSLQHEVASLSRRQGTLEDELLELMETRESAESQVADFKRQLDVIGAERATAVAARDEVFEELDDAQQKRQVERERLVGTLPSDLVALYDRVRESSGGVGAALLRQRRCEGCRLELAGSELSEVRSAKADQVLRCDNCRRILVRSDESGL